MIVIKQISTQPLTYAITIEENFSMEYEVETIDYSANALSNTVTIAILLRENNEHPNLFQYEFQQVISGLDLTSEIHVIVTITLENANNPIITHQASSYEIERPIPENRSFRT